MAAVAIIPARFGSTRFPGKPLARQTGKPLIQHVVERVASARSIATCIVATDDERIADAVRSFGGAVEMTREDHPSGTDRIAEVAARRSDLDPRTLIVNVQGDEPEIEPASLDQLVSRLEDDPRYSMGTLACPFPADSDPADPNSVKVALSQRGEALYFSRALIPYPRDAAARLEGARAPRPLLHLGVYAYRRAFLLEVAGWQPTPLEQTEKLEQLRVLEHGHAIAVEVVDRAYPGVDTPADYERFVARWRASDGAVASRAAHF